MNRTKKLFYEVRHVINDRQPYIAALIGTHNRFFSALSEARRLRKQSPGRYFVVCHTTQIVYASKYKKEKI